jgi:hypothetical protein
MVSSVLNIALSISVTAFTIGEPDIYNGQIADIQDTSTQLLALEIISDYDINNLPSPLNLDKTDNAILIQNNINNYVLPK